MTPRRLFTLYALAWSLPEFRKDALDAVKAGVIVLWAVVLALALAMPQAARAASPSDLSPDGSSCKHCIAIARAR